MIHTLEARQTVAADIDEVWEFFSNPENLAKVTPPQLGFVITSKLPEKMYAGMIIGYKVRPLLNLPLTWVSEITQIKKRKFFIDEQRRGPYKMWHHEHHFREVDGGVEIHDIISYELPLSPFSEPIHRLIVKKKLKEIFSFRETVAKQRFGFMDAAKATLTIN